MSSISSCFRLLIPPWKRRRGNFWTFVRSSRKIGFGSRGMSSLMMKDDSVPKQSQLGYDPSEELFGLDVDLHPRNIASATPKPRSWFGPNGQYIRELPCPSCRGRGYTPCTECGIERSRLDCSQCNGKGIMTCRQCLGDCVIWEESIDEQPWEKARSSSPFKVKEDDEVDNLDIKLKVRRKSKRVYQSPPPEVGLKISRSLRSLNAKTGLFSKRMKIIHRDPTLHAQRVAAIKKAKGTAAARKRASEALKAFFRDPENRRKRSIAMKGVKFYCSICGREGHRKHYCPEHKERSLERRYRCQLCGERGHNRRTCQKSRSSESKRRESKHQQCTLCGQSGHNRQTCGQQTGSKPVGHESRKHHCRVCGQSGHNCRTCPQRSGVKPGTHDSRHHHCRLCGLSDHNRRTCPQRAAGKEADGHDSEKGMLVSKTRNYTCGLCHGEGHNTRTCPSREKKIGSRGGNGLGQAWVGSSSICK